MNARVVLAICVVAAAACRESAPPDADVDDAASPVDASVTDGPFRKDAPDNAPYIIRLTPVDEAADVALGMTLSAWFSQRMDPLTFDASSFTLTRDGHPVAGTVTYYEDSQIAKFQPAEPLARHATYRARVANTVRDEAGVPLVAPVTWSFTTAEHGWDGNVLLGEGTRNSSFSAIVDCDGVVHVGWHQPHANGEDLWTRQYVPGEGWQAPEPLSAGSGSQSLPTFVCEGGHMAAAWIAGDNVYVRRFVRGVGWAAPVRINHVSLGELDGFQIVIDIDGDIIVAWQDYDRPADIHGAWVRRLRADGSLDAAVTCESITGVIGCGTLAVSGRRAALYFQHRVDSEYSLWTSHDDGSGWTPRTLIASRAASDIDVVRGDDGDVTLVWSSFESETSWTHTQLSASEHAGVWSTPTELTRDSVIWYREVRREPSGVIHAVWSDLDSWRMRAARFVPGVGWEAPVVLDEHAYIANWPQTAVDENGVVYVVYQDGDWGNTVVTAQRHVPGVGWEPAAPISDIGYVGRTWTRVVPLRGGGAMALWCDLVAVDTACQLWANIYR